MTVYVELPHAVGVLEALGLHVRDIGLLSSALARPSSSTFGTEAYPELEVKAAALLSSKSRLAAKARRGVFMIPSWLTCPFHRLTNKLCQLSMNGSPLRAAVKLLAIVVPYIQGTLTWKGEEGSASRFQHMRSIVRINKQPTSRNTPP